MKCNLNLKKTSNKDILRLNEELCKLRCYKCGSVIKVCKLPIFMIYEERKMPLCERCKGE